jgi:ribose 5-phosphate isomerase A
MAHDNIIQHEIAKRTAGYAAVDFVQDGMVVGLGTGSTAFYFIEKLIEKFKQGLKIQAVATSVRSEEQARAGGIPILDINTLPSIDLTVDGADEIDLKKQMIKGGGGALLREKIVASMSKEVVIVVDESKQVDKLGRFPLPVEIVSFAVQSIINRIEKNGLHGKLRLGKSDKLYLTDNGNYIYDIHFEKTLNDPEKIEHQLREIVGVVETGLFIHLAGRVIVGYNNGNVEIHS